MKIYKLIIHGWIPVEFDDDELLPVTQEELRELYENCEVDPYDFDDCVLRIEPDTSGKYTS
jgi:hypothetical protein